MREDNDPEEAEGPKTTTGNNRDEPESNQDSGKGIEEQKRVSIQMDDNLYPLKQFMETK